MTRLRRLHLPLVAAVTILFATCTETDSWKEIRVKDYQEKVYAAWLGQMVGNIYGLVHENLYVDEPGPNDFPYGYDYRKLRWMGVYATDLMKRYDGAFSDDDTDIEYMYLLQMEKHGAEPSYQDLAEAWKYHVRDYIWIANRAALRLMHYGYSPPLTGKKGFNEHWFQIDPQLVNEIWAVTAPGMVRYAAAKSDWAARITNDDWGVEPTVLYGAMYAAAFFEKDVNKLVDIGSAALPPESRFVKTVEFVKKLYAQYPDDWETARRLLAGEFYISEDEKTMTIWNANLNGACGILALLYGQGDFLKTLDMACYLGFDADNQAATMCGLVGLINGVEGIPPELLHPVEGWDKPFNDSYKNRTRFDLPDVRITDMGARTALQGEKVILSHGGETFERQGEKWYRINTEAEFLVPLELPPAPLIHFNVGDEVTFDLNSPKGVSLEWEIMSGALPPGIIPRGGFLRGIAEAPGRYQFELELRRGPETVSQVFEVYVLSENLADRAQRILGNREVPQLERLRDGVTSGEVVSTIDEAVEQPRADFYGYGWDEKTRVDTVVFHTGKVEEFGGWFNSIAVEYQDEAGEWQVVEELVVSPDLDLTDNRFAKTSFVPYLLRFKPVETKSIRLVGSSSWIGSEVDEQPRYFTTIAELSVFDSGF